MKITKAALQELIHEELSNISVSTENIEEVDQGRAAGWEHPALPGRETEKEAKIEWLIERIGELFKRLTELEKQIGVEWRGGDE